MHVKRRNITKSHRALRTHSSHMRR